MRKLFTWDYILWIIVVLAVSGVGYAYADDAYQVELDVQKQVRCISAEAWLDNASYHEYKIYVLVDTVKLSEAYYHGWGLDNDTALTRANQMVAYTFGETQGYLNSMKVTGSDRQAKDFALDVINSCMN